MGFCQLEFEWRSTVFSHAALVLLLSNAAEPESRTVCIAKGIAATQKGNYFVPGMNFLPFFLKLFSWPSTAWADGTLLLCLPLLQLRGALCLAWGSQTAAALAGQGAQQLERTHGAAGAEPDPSPLMSYSHQRR